MLELAQWLSDTPISLAIRQRDWLIPLLQTIHILGIAMVVSSVFLIDLRILQITRSQSTAATAHRYVPWIWTGLGILATSGLTLIIAEPQRALPNPAFQIKMLLLSIAIATTCAFQTSLRRNASFWEGSGPARMMNVLAMGVFVLWCSIALAGRLIAYLQPA